jgi:bisphosphoglycerate-dependent phosphoglycerate mutase
VANIFTGWVDVDLSEKGLGEAKGAGELLKAQKRVLGAFGYLGLCMALHFGAKNSSRVLGIEQK